MVAAYPATLITDLTSEAGLHADLHNQLLGATYNVKAYGALGDGATNDTAAFASASSVATEIFFPGSPTPYIFSPTTITRSNIRYRGTHGQTTLKLTSQLGGANAALFTTGSSNLVFEDIIFDGNSGTISSGNYWGGLINLLAGAYQITFRRCTFQNTARSAVYGLGSSGSQIAGIVFDDCRFTGIGTAGAGTGGACVMLEQNIHDCNFRFNRAYGALTSNFVKLKGDSTLSPGNSAFGNLVDYSTITGLDTANMALGLEFWTGCPNSRIQQNEVIGPPDAWNTANGQVWGISTGYAPKSSITGNIVRKGGTNNTKIEFGMEVAECPYTTVVGNSVDGANYGTNLTNNVPEPCHGMSIVGNTWANIAVQGLAIDSGPTGLGIHENTLIDAGQRNIMVNTTNAIAKSIDISGNKFLIKDQTVNEAGKVTGIYVLGTAKTDSVPVDIHHNIFGPVAGGASTLGISPLYSNNPQNVRFRDNSHCDGARPSDGAATAAWCAEYNGYNGVVSGNRAISYASGFTYADTGQIHVVENNDIGALAMAGTGGAGSAIPTAVAGANAGTTPPAPVVAAGSMPRSGSLTFGTGTTPAAGAQAVVTFPWKMRTTPFVVLTALNTAAQALGFYVSSVTNAGFTVSCTTAPAGGQANTVYGVSWMALVP